MDDRLRKGPLEDRGCKDVFFILLYLLLWGAMGYIAYFALYNGDPNKLLSPFDIVYLFDYIYRITINVDIMKLKIFLIYMF